MLDLKERLNNYINENKESFSEEELQKWQELYNNEQNLYFGYKEFMNEANLKECDHCGKIITDDEAVYTDDDAVLCQDCYDNETQYCEYCDRTYYYDDDFSETTNGDYCCQNCRNDHEVCNDCGRVIMDDDYYYADDTGNYYCTDCYEDNVHYCENCGNWYERGHYDRNDNFYCDECWDDRDNVIHDYGYKPSPEFKKLSNERNPKEFMGVEVEVDGDGDFDVLGEVEDDLEGLVYWKHDGSLDEGAEMVSHPCTIKYWMQMKQKMAEEFEKIVRAGFRSHDTTTCGYHIHISRNSLGKTKQEQDDVIDRIILITEVFKQELKRFSRRKSYGYCHFASESGSGYSEQVMDDLEKCKRFKDHCSDRYLVINNNNRNTVEFRVFRGTLNIETFIATLQFVHNVCNIAKKRKLNKFNGIKWADIINYTRDYKELKEYNKLRGIESHTKIDLFKDVKRG